MYNHTNITNTLRNALSINNFIKLKNTILEHNNVKIANKKNKYKKKKNSKK
tara:strand:+ start:65 stop:217 length:153 start_codon:yes stop_codon:yes gene_type:complete